MTVYSKFNIIYRLQRWLDSVPGQTFLNYAYSWGASVVILGTLFKLTHLPGANIMLYFGMGTEVVVFFISAFDRPFDKTADGKDLPTHVEEETVPNLAIAGGAVIAGGTPAAGGAAIAGDAAIPGGTPAAGGAAIAGGTGIGGTIVLAGGGNMAPTPDMPAADSGTNDGQELVLAGGQTAGGGSVAGGTVIAGGVIGGAVPNAAPETPEEMEERKDRQEKLKDATDHYIEELNNLTDMMREVAQQSQRLTRDSEEMENLNRTLTGISRVYEMQLKGASQQIGTIDQINANTQQMAQQIAELNKIYARMIESMTAGKAVNG